MTSQSVDELRTLIGEVRMTFRLLAGLSDRMLENRGLTGSLRAILEFISNHGPSPVPKMATDKSMTRQSVQSLVDRLVSLGLVETVDNPAHKRSVLVALTNKGRETFSAILAEEQILLSNVAGHWPEGDAQRAAGILHDFREKLRVLENGGEHDPVT